MYPDFSYLFHDLIGTQPDNWLSLFKTFGFMMILAILAAMRLFYMELKRKEKLKILDSKVEERVFNKKIGWQDLLSTAGVAFIVGYKIPYVIQNLGDQNSEDLLLSRDGNWLWGIVLALIGAAWFFYERHKQAELMPEVKSVKVFPSDRIETISFVGVLSGILGAKVFAIIEDLPGFFSNPIDTLFSGQGLAIYGGLIFGFLGGYIYIRRNNIKALPVLDAVAPALIIAYGIGRIGCQLSGDGDWGIVAAAMPEWWFLPDWMWAYDYPHAVAYDYPTTYTPEGTEVIAGCESRFCHRLSPPVYPTPFYETIMAFIIGGILWALRKRVDYYFGMLFAIYLIFNGVERFFIEFFRVNDQYNMLGFALSQAQIIAICLMLIGSVMAVLVYRKGIQNNT